MKTINYTIKAESNSSKKTFTIRKYDKGKLYAKYRTSQMSEDEFEENLLNTEADWKNFLRTAGDYYTV